LFLIFLSISLLWQLRHIALNSKNFFPFLSQSGSVKLLSLHFPSKKKILKYLSNSFMFFKILLGCGEVSTAGNAADSKGGPATDAAPRPQGVHKQRYF
jgi:hypothetical protein